MTAQLHKCSLLSHDSLPRNAYAHKNHSSVNKKRLAFTGKYQRSTAVLVFRPASQNKFNACSMKLERVDRRTESKSGGYLPTTMEDDSAGMGSAAIN
ncbi:hypothetical protein BaRGS_00035253 [Batillaria attramentaria]|uniref:Uncharacterized protein n=1 Tax=Batillaria attramentaria TaxID=370345 RepID=A0ABD0JFB7_9CAEN